MEANTRETEESHKLASSFSRFTKGDAAQPSVPHQKQTQSRHLVGALGWVWNGAKQALCPYSAVVFCSVPFAKRGDEQFTLPPYSYLVSIAPNGGSGLTHRYWQPRCCSACGLSANLVEGIELVSSIPEHGFGDLFSISAISREIIIG